VWVCDKPEDGRWKTEELMRIHIEVSKQDALQNKEYILAYLRDQTSLEFTLEKRTFRHWTVK